MKTKKSLLCLLAALTLLAQTIPSVMAETTTEYGAVTAYSDNIAQNEFEKPDENLFNENKKLFDVVDYTNGAWTLPDGSSTSGGNLTINTGKAQTRGYGGAGDATAMEFKMSGPSIYSDIAIYDCYGRAITGFTYGRQRDEDGFWAGHGERSYGGALKDAYNINRFSNYLKTDVIGNSVETATGRFRYETGTVCRIQIENKNGIVEGVLYNATSGANYKGDYYTVKYFKDDLLISTEYYAGSRNGISAIETQQKTYYNNFKIYGEENEAMDKLLEDLREITVPEKVNSDITLPTNGKNGSSITWVSDKPNVITNDGKYSQPLSGTTTVTLTATFVNGSAAKTKSFEVTVEYQKSDNIVTLENISTADVTLTDKFLLNAEAKDIEYLLSLDPERFLYNWYITSGLTPTKDGYEDSWERTTKDNFRGHMFGHYMSSLAQAYNATSDATLKARLLDKIKASVNGFIACQKAYAKKYPDRAGFAAPFSEYWFNKLDGVDSGNEAWNQKESNNPNTLVPWYNMHKVVAGLIDVHKYITDDEIGSAAFEAVQDYVDYIYNCRVSKYTDAQKAKMLTVEYGGMAESLWELYNLTGKAEYKICAEGFMENSLFTDLAAGKDVLSGKHANTTIPKFIGSLKKYLVLTQNEEYYNALSQAEKDNLNMYLTAAENFFDIVLASHSYVTGGNSVQEHFRAANTISSYYDNPETHETCNEYNMLKLARELFKLTNDKKYSDYYEKAFMNAILASQNPKTGDMTYFQPMGSGYSKVFNKDRFWCCTGTGTENFTKLGDSIYFRKDERVYVNMYYSSVLRDAEHNMTLTTTANIPNSENVKITVKAINGEVKKGTDLYLRLPEWCAAAPTVKYNGKKIDNMTLSGGYAVIKGLKNGDVIDLTFPMQVTVEQLKDNKNIVAFKYGPAVLAARLGQNNVGQNAATGIMVLKAVGDMSLPSSIVLSSSSAEDFKKNINDHMIRIDDTDDGFAQFRLDGTYLDDSVTFVPYYSVYDYRYGVYMSLAAKDSAEMIEMIMAEKEGLRLEEAASASLMQIDNNNYEATYNMQKSENSSFGSYSGKNYRDAQKNGWFSYDLPIETDAVNSLNTVYTKADNGRSFKILINGEDFVTETITNSASAGADGFYTVSREIPAKYTSGGGVQYKTINGESTPCVTVKFQSNGGLVGGLYGISVTHGFDDNPNLKELAFEGCALSPEFNPDTKEYTLAVPKYAKSVKMKAMPEKASGLIYEGGILIDDTQTREINLDETDKITLKTYAQDHETNTEYTINIVRAEVKITDVEITGRTLKCSLDIPDIAGVTALAFYDKDGVLIELKTDDEITEPFNVPDGVTAGSVKVMMWNTLDGMKPVAAADARTWELDN